jgi:trypsin
MIANCSKLAAVGVLFMIINVSQSANLRGQQFQNELEEIDMLEAELERELADFDNEAGPFDFDPNNIVDLGTTESKDTDIDGAEARIVGGYAVPNDREGIPNAYAAILRDTGTGGHSFSNCGATLITECHVATAAHCVSGREGENDIVYINARQMNNAYTQNGGNVFHWSAISGQTMHSSYYSGSKSNDVAILTLAECVPASKISLGIEIATFGDSGTCQQNGLLAAGYGRLTQDSYTKPDVLQAVTLDYISNADCDASYGGIGKIDSGMTCAGYSTGGKDSCQGDSGGPLFSYDRKFCGIVSWGSGCAQAGKPGVYASAVYFRQWFKDQACSDGRLTSGANSLCY